MPTRACTAPSSRCRGARARGARAARRRGPRAWWTSRASPSRTSRPTPRASSASAAARARASATSRPCAGCCAPSGATRFRVELQRPFHRHDRALNRGLAALAARLGVPCVATGNVHAHTPARARLQDAFVAIREHTTLDASEPLRRGNHSHVLATPEAMAARFADHPDAVAETERLADTLRFDLTSDLGYRYPGAEDGGADRKLAEVCHALLRGPLPARLDGCAREAAARLEEELRLIAKLGLSGFFLLHRDMLELAREVAVEVRGTRHRPRAAAARARARVVGVLDRLLPHRPLARRPDRQQAAARALPQRGDHVAARHRPRLPARRARGPDPARARALRARPLRARRRLPDLPRARRDPRARQGARACRRGRSSASRAARRAGRGRTSTATSPPRWGPGARPRAAGAGWASWPRRRTACRATSPSTPAG